MIYAKKSPATAFRINPILVIFQQFMSKMIITPEGWPAGNGYSHAIKATGQTLWISGQIGWNHSKVFDHKDFIGQTEQALNNIITIVEAADGRPSDIVRMLWFVIDKQEYLDNQKQLGKIYRTIMGHHYPAMAVVEVRGLIEDEARLEIEAVAVLS